MYLKRIICLANSRKPPSGRCIAGKEINNNVIGTWIRPVSERASREVSEEERRYENGIRANLLDIIHVPLINHEPLNYQTENHILDKEYYWINDGRATWTQVRSALDQFDPHFWTNHESTRYGQNDKVVELNALMMNSSLKLISLNSLVISVVLEPGFENSPARRRVRGKFLYNGMRYVLGVSDPVVEERYLRGQNGEFEVGACIVCISLVELFHSYAFRVIASVITPDMCAPEN